MSCIIMEREFLITTVGTLNIFCKNKEQIIRTQEADILQDPLLDKSEK
jgi:hypothetical protein